MGRTATTTGTFWPGPAVGCRSAVGKNGKRRRARSGQARRSAARQPWERTANDDEHVLAKPGGRLSICPRPHGERRASGWFSIGVAVVSVPRWRAVATRRDHFCTLAGNDALDPKRGTRERHKLAPAKSWSGGWVGERHRWDACDVSCGPVGGESTVVLLQQQLPHLTKASAAQPGPVRGEPAPDNERPDEPASRRQPLFPPRTCTSGERRPDNSSLAQPAARAISASGWSEAGRLLLTGSGHEPTTTRTRWLRCERSEPRNQPTAGPVG